MITIFSKNKINLLLTKKQNKKTNLWKIEDNKTNKSIMMLDKV